MSKYYITFAADSFVGNYYFILGAPNATIARLHIIDTIIRQNKYWCGCYSEDVWNTEVSKHYPEPWQQLILPKTMKLTDSQLEEYHRNGMRE